MHGCQQSTLRVWLLCAACRSEQPQRLKACSQTTMKRSSFDYVLPQHEKSVHCIRSLWYSCLPMLFKFQNVIQIV